MSRRTIEAFPRPAKHCRQAEPEGNELAVAVQGSKLEFEGALFEAIQLVRHDQDHGGDFVNRICHRQIRFLFL